MFITDNEREEVIPVLEKEDIAGLDAKLALVGNMIESAKAGFRKTGLFLGFIWKSDQSREWCQRIAADGFNAGCQKVAKNSVFAFTSFSSAVLLFLFR